MTAKLGESARPSTKKDRRTHVDLTVRRYLLIFTAAHHVSYSNFAAIFQEFVIRQRGVLDFWDIVKNLYYFCTRASRNLFLGEESIYHVGKRLSIHCDICMCLCNKKNTICNRRRKVIEKEKEQMENTNTKKILLNRRLHDDY